MNVDIESKLQEIEKRRRLPIRRRPVRRRPVRRRPVRRRLPIRRRPVRRRLPIRRRRPTYRRRRCYHRQYRCSPFYNCQWRRYPHCNRRYSRWYCYTGYQVCFRRCKYYHHSHG